MQEKSGCGEKERRKERKPRDNGKDDDDGIKHISDSLYSPFPLNIPILNTA